MLSLTLISSCQREAPLKWGQDPRCSPGMVQVAAQGKERRKWREAEEKTEEVELGLPTWATLE